MDLEKCFCGGTFSQDFENTGHPDLQSVDAEYNRWYMECDQCNNQYMTKFQVEKSRESLARAKKLDGKRDHEAEAAETIERYKSRGGIIPASMREYKSRHLARAIDQNEFHQMFVRVEGADVRIVISDYMDSMVFDMDRTVQQEMIDLLQKNVAT